MWVRRETNIITSSTLASSECLQLSTVYTRSIRSIIADTTCLGYYVYMYTPKYSCMNLLKYLRVLNAKRKGGLAGVFSSGSKFRFLKLSVAALCDGLTFSNNVSSLQDE